MQNRLTASSSSGHYYYTDGSMDYDASIVGMPYLLVVIKKIFKHFGYPMTSRP